MYNNKRILGIIPARGGSKGVPGKNIKPLDGKPLIAWTIKAAKESKYLDRLILSSDSLAIIKVAKQYGCNVPFVRPSELSQDETPGISPVLHVIEQVPDYEYIVLLQPTSPFRSAGDIDRCIEICLEQYGKACISVSEVKENPSWMYHIQENKILSPLLDAPLITRRQNLPKVYKINGAVYVAKAKWLQKSRSFMGVNTVAYVMPHERSLDIDTPFDFRIAEMLVDEHLPAV